MPPFPGQHLTPLPAWVVWLSMVVFVLVFVYAVTGKQR